MAETPGGSELAREERPIVSFPVVGVGASAGGLEAFSQLLEHLPHDSGMGFVLIQHLDPTHESKLSELLGRFTRMRVVEATDGVAVKPDRVYVIPPNTSLTIEAQGILRVEPREHGRGPHLPIDVFFKSLAGEWQNSAIAVILSGTGSDGTLGLEEVKAGGGITFAQDEQTAKYAGMPQSAARSGCVDLILSPQQIAVELARIGRHPYVAPTTTESRPLPESEGDYFKILALLRSAFGVDFTAYRDTTIRRRIMRRMVVHTKNSLATYARHLENDRAELEALYHDVLINVTSFFREPETFEALKTSVFAVLIERTSNHPIRIWAPGCSTGQEAYSLAMAMLEFLDGNAQRPSIQIFATDLNDTVSLTKAREGIYPDSIEAEVSPERLRRFFMKENDHYRINKDLRDMVVFAKQNVAADPPFSHLDLISCRNLLIYLSPVLQRRVIPTFHYALNADGFLILGASETIGTFSELFATVDREHRIYKKKSTAARQYPHFQLEGVVTTGHEAIPTAPSAADWQREADRVAAGQYVPPGVLVNENLDILQFRGQTGPYLAPSAGEPSHNLLRMAREGLFPPLRSAITECQQTSSAAHRQGVRVRGEGADREIALHVLPLTLPRAGERCLLILFDEFSRHPAAPTTGTGPPAREGDGSVSDENDFLRNELASTREYLQSVIENQEAGNEELQSANEEILSANEELQSTNEELETAKEELQSVNEELTTVNEQLQQRNLEVTRLSDDLTNLLASANVPKIVLGSDLRIRRFTPAAGKLLNLLATDVGRPIGNLKLTVDIPDLEGLVGRVIESVQATEREVRDQAGRWFLLRIHPYRTTDNRIDGTVLVLMDIDALKRAEAELRESAEKQNRHIAQLAEIDRYRTEFLGLLAHELRNPLAPIRNAVQIIRRAGDTPEIIHTTCEMMERQVAHMARLVDDLLDSARMRRGRLELQKIRIDVTDTLSRAVESVRPAAVAMNQTLAIVQPSRAVFVDADPVRMAQVFENLLQNAVKYTPHGGHISVSAELRDRDIVIQVQDTGIGIAAEQLPRIFEMFAQVNTSLERSLGGLGIGLALARQLTALHGGTLTAASEGLGNGSTFIVTVPLAADQSPPIAFEGDDAGQQEQAQPLPRKSVLIVDDNEDAATSLALLLEFAGHEVHMAFDGIQAVEAAERIRPDIVLLDIGLPKLNGYEVARKIRGQAWGEKTVLISLTGWGQAEDRESSRQAGINAHLVKPVNYEELMMLMREETPDPPISLR